MTVVYSAQARTDLHEIYEYIALTLLSPENASAAAEKIMQTARSLENMPERNPLYSDEPWKGKGLRYTAAGNFMLFYTVDMTMQAVFISRIIYGGRDIRRELDRLL